MTRSESKHARPLTSALAGALLLLACSGAQRDIEAEVALADCLAERGFEYVDVIVTEKEVEIGYEEGEYEEDELDAAFEECIDLHKDEFDLIRP